MPDLKTDAGIAEVLGSVKPRILPPELRERYDSLKYADPKEHRQQLAREVLKYQQLVDMVVPELTDLGIATERQGTLNVDVAALNELSLSGLREALKDRIGKYTAFDTIQLLMAAFLDREVVDLNHPEAGAKPLFFTPETLDEVVDLDQLRAAQFHLTPWQFVGKFRWKRPTYPLSDPNADPKLTPQLVAYTTALYHPDFGDACREPDGKLSVLDRNHSLNEVSGQPQRYSFASQAFTQHYGIQMRSHEAENPATAGRQPALFAQQFLQPLFNRGLLRESDFRTVSGTRTEEALGREAPVGKDGGVMLDGVKYYFGKPMHHTNVRVTKLTNEIGIAFRESEQGDVMPVRTFRLLQPNEWQGKSTAELDAIGVVLSPGKTGKGYPMVRQRDGMGRLTLPSDPEELLRELPGETKQQFVQRVQAWQAFSVERRMLRQHGQLWRQLPLREQLLAAGAIRQLTDTGYDQARLKRFYQVGGVDGLRALQVTEYAPQLAKMVVELGLHFSDRTDLKEGERTIAQRLFEKYASIVEQVGQIKSYLQATFAQELTSQPELIDRIANSLFERGKTLLEKFNTARGDPESILAELERIEASIYLDLITYKSLKRENPSLSLETFGSVKTEVMSGASIPEALKAQMRTIFGENRQASPDAEALTGFAREQFERGLTRDDNQVYIILSAETVLGFTRLDPEPDLGPDHLHVGSLNVDLNYQRYSLANVLLDLVKQKIDDGMVVHSDARPKLAVLPDYIRRFGRVIVGLNQVPTERGKVPLFELVGDRQLNDQSRFQRLPFEQIQAAYPGTNDYHLDDAAIVLKFDGDREYDVMLATAQQILDTNRYAGTVYQRDPANPAALYLVFEPLLTP